MNTFETITQFGKMLRNLDRWIEKASAYATSKSFDPNVFVHCRLAPDQYSFARQVQAACDAAKFAAAYLAGKQAPAHPDTEQTIPELRERIQKCLSFLETLKANDFAGAEERKVSPPYFGGKWVPGNVFLMEAATPNFYFHLTTAYSILRHNGVEIGKLDFVGSLALRD